MGNNAETLRDKQFLFLDRDGVINVHRKNDYVKSIEEFEFLPGVEQALVALSKRFARIIIITNQRGVGKGKMSEATLLEIHKFLRHRIEQLGGHIDAIYYCTELDDSHPQRKPNGGMAHQAKNDFPEIIFSQSIMAGDSKTDIEFGKNMGMSTILIHNTILDCIPFPDFVFPSLAAFALSMENE
jgi:D-glycero-D-manno-heptose 1,7-bisphosphate phosphatase/D-glycero-alpha-D-manno-heptose 1-phosphate guanylyltransferase